MAKGFFADKVVHFSSCRTFSNKAESKAFKKETDALLVSGYQRPVSAYDSSIADMACLNNLMSQSDVIDTDHYTDTNCDFWVRYESLLYELRFVAI